MSWQYLAKHFLKVFDDGVLCGPREVIIHNLKIITKDGPPLGLHWNLAKCVLLSFDVLKVGHLYREQSFPPQITKRSHLPNLEILGAPIETYCWNLLFYLCLKKFLKKRIKVKELILQLSKLNDPRVAVTLLLWKCRAYSRLVHLLGAPLQILWACLWLSLMKMSAVALRSVGLFNLLMKHDHRHVWIIIFISIHPQPTSSPKVSAMNMEGRVKKARQ